MSLVPTQIARNYPEYSCTKVRAAKCIKACRESYNPRKSYLPKGLVMEYKVNISSVLKEPQCAFKKLKYTCLVDKVQLNENFQTLTHSCLNVNIL